VNDQRSATLSDKPKAGKEKVVSTRICGETSCNQILARFPLVKSPTKGLNVLYNPFRERTPNTLAFGEIKPYIGSLKDGRLDLVYYRDPGLDEGDQFPLWTLH
jgi:hypothetical protein